MSARHECSRCGHREVVERMVFSTWTRKRYCQDIKACAKRAARQRKTVKA